MGLTLCIGLSTFVVFLALWWPADPKPITPRRRAAAESILERMEADR